MSPHDSARRRREEFEAVALSHLPSLLALARRLTRNAGDAEDLVQETLLRAYRFQDGLEPGTNAKAWLFRILKNAFVSGHRRRKARPVEVDFDAVEARHDALLDHAQSGSVDNPEELLASAILGERVEAGLAEMPEEYRFVVVLCLVEGFSYAEAAEALEIPIGTVMSRLHRGRRFLQARLLEQARERGLLGQGNEDAEPGASARRAPPGGPR